MAAVFDPDVIAQAWECEISRQNEATGVAEVSRWSIAAR